MLFNCDGADGSFAKDGQRQREGAAFLAGDGALQAQDAYRFFRTMTQMAEQEAFNAGVGFQTGRLIIRIKISADLIHIDCCIDETGLFRPLRCQRRTVDQSTNNISLQSATLRRRIHNLVV